MSANPLPRRLAEELKSLPKYREGADELGMNQSHSQNQQQPASYLHPSGISGLTAEEALYDNILGPLLPKTRLPDIQLKSKTGGAVTGASNDDFSSALLHRLTDLEKQNKDLRRQLAEQIVKNQRLENLNQRNEELLRRFRVKNQKSAIETLQLENSRLMNQVEEMESFLEDYGLVWVGSHGNADVNADAPSLVDVETLRRKVDELNNLLSNEPAQIKIENKQAKLVRIADAADKITITVYRNGIYVNDGKFRSNESEAYTRFIHDILDGYFPFEFKNRFPDGMFMELVDKHTVEYSPMIPESVTAEEVLRKIPKSVIYKGEILDVRSDLASKLSKPNQVSRVVVIPTDPIPDGVESATVNVKWIDNSVFQLKLHSTTKVGVIKQCIQDYLSSNNISEIEFNLYTVYPVKLVDVEWSLQAAGCCPQGVLQARKR